MEPGVSKANSVPCGYVLNRTRRVYLATRLAVADRHWTRLRGLIGKRAGEFREGDGLWISPCHGVHTWLMGFSIDVAYLDGDHVVLHLEHSLAPWRFAPVRRQATSVLELPANTLRATGTTIGDELEIETRTPGDSPPA
jgi:uncharacterized membrane protein (UPF0127 family)